MNAYLDHIGIAVSDLPSSLAFFKDALGLNVHASEEVTSQKVRAHFLHAEQSSLELLEATDKESPIARFLAKRGPGLHHITLRVNGRAHTVELNLEPSRGSFKAGYPSSCSAHRRPT